MSRLINFDFFFTCCELDTIIFHVLEVAVGHTSNANAQLSSGDKCLSLVAVGYTSNANAHLSSGDRYLRFGRIIHLIHLIPYFKCVNS